MLFRSGFHQTVDHGTGLRSVDGIHDVPVGSANGERTDCPLCGRIINGDFTVFQKYPQIIFPIHAVSQTILVLLTDDTEKVLGMNL